MKSAKDVALISGFFFGIGTVFALSYWANLGVALLVFTGTLYFMSGLYSVLVLSGSFLAWSLLEPKLSNWWQKYRTSKSLNLLSLLFRTAWVVLGYGMLKVVIQNPEIWSMPSSRLFSGILAFILLSGNAVAMFFHSYCFVRLAFMKDADALAISK